VDYVERVNRAIDHVVSNLAHSLTLQEVSAFEAWIGRPFVHGSEHFEIACQLPIEPSSVR
jgi:hypothetical protein